MLYGPANLSIHVYSLCHPCSVILVIAHHWVYRTISQQPWVLPSGFSDLMWFDVAQLESPAIKLQNGRCHWSSFGWCFGTFCIFHNIWDNPSRWLIFFKMVETTTQLFLLSRRSDASWLQDRLQQEPAAGSRIPRWTEYQIPPLGTLYRYPNMAPKEVDGSNRGGIEY